MLRRLAIRIGIGFGGLVAVGIIVVVAASCAIRQRTGAYIYDVDEAVPAHDWAIVLGAMVKPGGVPSDALRDRLETARGLYAAGLVQRIYVSGDGRGGEDAVMARWLVANGVPADRIVRDGTGFRTRQTMENAWAYGIRDAVVCTQRFHLARSVAWARHVGIDAVGYESDRLAYTHHFKDDVREAAARTIALLEIWAD